MDETRDSLALWACGLVPRLRRWIVLTGRHAGHGEGNLPGGTQTTLFFSCAGFDFYAQTRKSISRSTRWGIRRPFSLGRVAGAPLPAALARVKHRASLGDAKDAGPLRRALVPLSRTPS